MNPTRKNIAQHLSFLLALAFAGAAQGTDGTRAIAGWTLHIHPALLASDNAAATGRAVFLLRAQLEEIVRMAPPAAVAELQKVPLWFSPEYPGIPPRAEFHPDAGWLRAHGRDPAMAKGVEFTNIRIFDAECRRMPNFALHELAHAYHNRVLNDGFQNAEIKAAYEQAKAGGKYDRVERLDAEGGKHLDRAYALNNPQEYFAEITEAYFSRNDFFPHNRDQLLQADPIGHALVSNLWGVPRSRPNILIIFNDDQRADTIAALGNAVIKTPNLDRLCQRGLSFTRAYMQGGFNVATCVPSRAMLLSGRSLFQIDEKLQSDETWPAAFGRSGYTTFATGKWHNGIKSLEASFQNARAIFDGGMADPLHAPLSNLERGHLSKPESAPKHACEVFADEAVRFLQQAHDRPYLCYVAFDGPHDPHIVPDDFPVHYKPDARLRPVNFLPQHPFDNGEMTVRDELLLPHPRTARDVQRMNADYYRYISFLDFQIGRILGALAASPAASNTLVVFSADSGVARGSHGLIGKQNLYEHSIRVPLIIAGPGIPADQRTAAMCYLFDLMPALGALCGVTGPKSSAGIDLCETLRDPAHPARTELVFAYRQVQRAIRVDRWKLVRYPQIDRTQLFDLENDPQEQSDLAGEKELAGLVSDLTARLEAALKQYGDRCPLTVIDPNQAAWSPRAKAGKTARDKAARQHPDSGTR